MIEYLLIAAAQAGRGICAGGSSLDGMGDLRHGTMRGPIIRVGEKLVGLGGRMRYVRRMGGVGNGLTTVGSIGKRIVDYLDAAISIWATPSDVTVSLAVSATEAAAVASGTAAIKPYHDWSQTFLSTVTADLASATKIWTVGKADRDNNTDAEALFFIEEAEGLTVLAQAACASTGLGALAISGSSGDWEITVTLSAAATAALVQWRHKKGMTMSIKALVNGKTVDVWEGTLTISSATARAYS